MSIHQLPDEVLLEVFEVSSVSDIDNLALANKKLYAVSFSSKNMSRRRAAKLNSAAMRERFGIPIWNSIVNASSVRQFEHLREHSAMSVANFEPVSIPRSRIDAAAFTKQLAQICGEEPALKICAECQIHLPAKEPFSLPGFHTAVESLGLTLPRELLDVHAPTADPSSELETPPPDALEARRDLILRGLFKCPRGLDGGEGGFLVPLAWRDCDPGGWCKLTAFDAWALYLDREGHSGVMRLLRPLRRRPIMSGFMHSSLGGFDAVAEHMAVHAAEPPRKVLVPVADLKSLEMRLSTSSFAAWLALRYHEVLTTFEHHHDLPFSTPLEQFVEHAFAEGKA